MRTIISRLDRAAQRWFPAAYYRFIQKPKLTKQFKIEEQLVRGVSLARSKHPSILFFTTQKCASRYVGRVLNALGEAEGLIPVDYDAFVTTTKLSRELKPFSAEGALQHAFKTQGYLYGPLGTMRQIPQRKDYRVFLQLRDPRDVLTSLYYSTAYSHSLLNPALLRRRKEAQAMSIDEYVLQAAPQYLRIYAQYGDQLLGQPEVLLQSYERMVADFPGWLEALSAHLDLQGHPELTEQLLEEARFDVEKEDEYSHRRQVTPGDHLRKLQPETIKQLNELLAPVLETFGYSR